MLRGRERHRGAAVGPRSSRWWSPERHDWPDSTAVPPPRQKPKVEEDGDLSTRRIDV
jgi:hypothetical protein